ncbi:MAG: FliM/FliN family flagellar motor switch protein [Gammaproteobacteria bacterium]|nr:FliM/FliN family flagellar motor switch protein [Gammaproteobacteria bacterium]MDE0274086.1 FliM/FliN family flagellar motor switch protein [Gammaproteobacteria bacterium]
MNAEAPPSEPTIEDNALVEDDTPPGVEVEVLPVNLVFVAGELQVPFGELRKHGPGFVYELEGHVSSQVEIRANGRTIGIGELVELEGRFGVRILECR